MGRASQGAIIRKVYVAKTAAGVVDKSSAITFVGDSLKINSFAVLDAVQKEE